MFLDWSQAFGSIGHAHVQMALQRYGAPPIFVQAIIALYHEAKFYVSESEFQSHRYPIHRGLRQGCPLSPYLFIVVLSSLMLDIKTFFEGLYLHIPWTFSAQHPLTDLEYADDTVLWPEHRPHFTVSFTSCSILQPNGGFHSSHINVLLINTTLSISLSKTATATDPCLCEFCAPLLDLPIQPDSLAPPVPQIDTAKYLGAFISSNSSTTADINFRCSQASTAFHTLSPFFRHPLIHPNKKFQIY